MKAKFWIHLDILQIMQKENMLKDRADQSTTSRHMTLQNLSGIIFAMVSAASSHPVGKKQRNALKIPYDS